ncbi:regulatory protein, luxR family [Algoriphagus alkaliphilus]|uniref:Regulatory protein, luxR family n=1 Tax=Algoriphagus alkaliphilus TaxID=279824 RepID=A0A1G5V923_9BACT|nr:helix-turn-helix transcriptional regulator [Algoriphagus alkaliphilus]MBA4299341.1 LuxR family transcriptional regulator [Cyclobacterium sp.]SDA42362.1 regulatory protein, luxR family [Algoriphagus alkaliphilus]
MNELIKQKIEEIKSIEKNLPAMIIIHDIRDSTVVYMSEMALQGLGVSLKELIEMGLEYHERFFNPEDAKDYVPKILGLLERNNDDEIVSFFQQVRQMPNMEWAWFLSSIKILLRDKDNKPVLTLTTSIPVDAQHHIAAKSQRILDENNFLRKNIQIFSKLSTREKEVLRLLALGHSSPEISEILFISDMTATTHRRNIKEKLQAKSQYDYIRFAHAFDLI